MKRVLGFMVLVFGLVIYAESDFTINFNGDTDSRFSIIHEGTGTVTIGHVPNYSGQVFLSDQFVAANGTVNTTRTADIGLGWVEHSSFTAGEFSIQSNRAVTSSAANAAMNYNLAVPPIADYDVQATLRVLSANYTYSQGIVGRVSTSANTMILGRYMTNAWQCYQNVNGTATQIGVSSTTALISGADYIVKLTMDGTDVSLSVDGVEVVSGTTTVTAKGYAGIRGNSASTTTGLAIADIQGISR